MPPSWISPRLAVVGLACLLSACEASRVDVLPNKTEKVADFPATTANTADPSATPQAKAVYDYLAGLGNQANHKLISGQMIWRDMVLDMYAIENGLPRQPNDYTLGQQVQTQSGEYPGLLGFPEPSVIPDDPSARRLILDHWNAGGILMSSIFLGNGPAKWNGNGGSNLDTIMDDPRYIALLDAAVSNYLYYQSQGVVFLARVFPEMNGNWNWFSFSTDQQYKTLYIHYYNYMVSHGVHNLLYWYCPAGGFGKYLEYYPGDQYVDLVGLDWYGDIDSAPLIKVPGYDELLTTGKPFMLSEYGPFDSVTPFTYQPGKDFAQTLAGFKANMPKAIGWMNWSAPFNLSAMSNLTSMTDSYIQNRPVPRNTAEYRRRIGSGSEGMGPHILLLLSMSLRDRNPLSP